jgi:hypothetical protein
MALTGVIALPNSCLFAAHYWLQVDSDMRFEGQVAGCLPEQGRGIGRAIALRFRQ